MIPRTKSLKSLSPSDIGFLGLSKPKNETPVWRDLGTLGGLSGTLAFLKNRVGKPLLADFRDLGTSGTSSGGRVQSSVLIERQCCLSLTELFLDLFQQTTLFEAGVAHGFGKRAVESRIHQSKKRPQRGCSCLWGRVTISQ